MNNYGVLFYFVVFSVLAWIIRLILRLLRKVVLFCKTPKADKYIKMYENWVEKHFGWSFYPRIILESVLDIFIAFKIHLNV